MADKALKTLLKRMRADWDERARENAFYYVATGRETWTEEEFFESGRREVREQVLNDLENVCQGKDPKQMRVLEIGCGAGRVMRALAEVFGEVHGVDVSKEMIRLARRALEGVPNARVYQNNGMDLSAVPGLPFDFVFSTIVFQHISSMEVIENYVREVHRLLRPGGLFKFQVQGEADTVPSAGDTWVGIPISEEEAIQLAQRCQFEPRYRIDAGSQYFWLWFFKNP